MPARGRPTHLGAVVAVAFAVAGCNHVAEDMEEGIEKAAGIPQEKPATETAVIESYCYKGLGYGSDAGVICYREPQPELKGRLMGSTYDRPTN